VELAGGKKYWVEEGKVLCLGRSVEKDEGVPRQSCRSERDVERTKGRAASCGFAKRKRRVEGRGLDAGGTYGGLERVRSESWADKGGKRYTSWKAASGFRWGGNRLQGREHTVAKEGVKLQVRRPRKWILSRNKRFGRNRVLSLSQKGGVFGSMGSYE